MLFYEVRNTINGNKNILFSGKNENFKKTDLQNLNEKSGFKTNLSEINLIFIIYQKIINGHKLLPNLF